MRAMCVLGSAVFAGLCLAHGANASPPAATSSATNPQTTLASAAVVPKSVGATVPAQTSALQPADKRASDPKMTREARASAQRAAEEKLAGSDWGSIRQGLDALAELGGEPAATAIVARVRRGLPPPLTEQAIESLLRIHSVSAGPALLELTLHRRAQIRERAVSALGALKIRSAQSSLLYALDDSSPTVRAAAAQALGGVGTVRALPALWAAADRGVDHAFEAIGAIAGPKDVNALFERAKGTDIRAIEPALEAILERPNFPLPAKLAILQQIEQLGSPSARTYLVRRLDAWKERGQPRLRQALFDAIKRMDHAQQLLSAEPSPTPSQGAHP